MNSGAAPMFHQSGTMKTRHPLRFWAGLEIDWESSRAALELPRVPVKPASWAEGRLGWHTSDAACCVDPWLALLRAPTLPVLPEVLEELRSRMSPQAARQHQKLHNTACNPCQQKRGQAEQCCGSQPLCIGALQRQYVLADNQKWSGQYRTSGKVTSCNVISEQELSGPGANNVNLLPNISEAAAKCPARLAKQEWLS